MNGRLADWIDTRDVPGPDPRIATERRELARRDAQAPRGLVRALWDDTPPPAPEPDRLTEAERAALDAARAEELRDDDDLEPFGPSRRDDDDLAEDFDGDPLPPTRPPPPAPPRIAVWSVSPKRTRSI